MERVEIGDVAIAYDDPYSLETYLLVMRNVLLIPSMDHNLLPPFLVPEALLFLDETENSSRLNCRWRITLSMMK
jgi:hypothetical protein